MGSKYLNISEMPEDDLLRDLVTELDITNTHDFINDFSWSKGVDPVEIRNTNIPYKVKQLAINYTYMKVAQNKSIMNNKAQDGADAYELKRKVYAAEVDRLKDEITSKTLLGIDNRRSSIITVGMYRG